VEHTLNGTKVTLATNTYDNFGRLSTKTLHGSATNQLTYAYNIRNWLTGINSTRFTQNLYYNTGNGTACYNGNISSMTWKAGSESTIRGYKFSYDALSRLTNAVYGEGTAINSNANRFSENITNYDKNGNILALQRYGQTGASTYAPIDNLTFTLNGNQLNRVDDATSASAYNGGLEFKNGASTTAEYTYDENGNLTKDLNKNITDIQYNYLNLPSKITFTDGSTITYLYGADGTKLRTVHKIGSTTTTTDFCNDVIYENGTAKMLLTEEGYVSLSDGKYHYYLKDHQGNNRVVVDQSGNVEETNHYYPFGGIFASTGNIQPYKYNGKEFDSKKGLNWYDYGARMYDPALGRWHVVDPSSEKYDELSPYTYCTNNPIKNVDLDGKDWYMHSQTGELYFNQVTNQAKIEYNDRFYTRIGGNDMLGDMKDVTEQAYNFDESTALAKANGYSIKPIQQIQSEVSREQPYSTGRKTTTITTGKIDIVNEQYGIFSDDKSEKENIKTEYLFNPKPSTSDFIDIIATGAKKTDQIERNYFTYNKPNLVDKVKSYFKAIYTMGTSMTGKHDYRDITIHKNWNDYNKATRGKGIMLEYRK